MASKIFNSFVRKLLEEILIALTIWFCIIILLIPAKLYFLIVIWLSIVPYGYFFFMLNLYRFIPQFERNNKKVDAYILNSIVGIIILGTPFFIISLLVGYHDYTKIFLLFLIITFVSLVLAWLVYLRNREKIYELIYLKKELKETTAHLQFLRSQINSHFLFNVLNALYGTALQENAERTSEGIQKLGDMMRFMLHENKKDKILLVTEVDYIRHYIDLQLLRIGTSSNILIETDIDEPNGFQYIAPMLLIPFVENAFKHGISLREKSWIKVKMQTAEKFFFFEVRNSIHLKNVSDTENEASGIGLKNVEQRLVLLYPQRHQLVINKATQEFIVRLTLNY